MTDFASRRETREVRIVLAGTSGGTGTTTIAALVFESLRHSLEGAPVLYDHSGGDLGARLTTGDDVPDLDDSLALHDLGPHAFTGGIDSLEAPHNLVIAVTPSTPAGLDSAADLLGTATARFGAISTSRLLVVANGAHGPGPSSRAATRGIASLRDRFGQGAVVAVPRDRALAGAGRIPLTRLALPTRRGRAALDQRTGDLLATHRRAR